MGVELQLVGGGEAAAPHSSQPFPLPGWLSQLPTRSSLRAPVQMLIALFFACLFATSGDVRRVPTLLPTARFLPTDCLRTRTLCLQQSFFWQRALGSHHRGARAGAHRRRHGKQGAVSQALHCESRRVGLTLPVLPFSGVRRASELSAPLQAGPWAPSPSRSQVCCATAGSPARPRIRCWSCR
jgi:hypothetical protein